jgi:cysteine desulfurase/selenocysteine lyase
MSVETFRRAFAADPGLVHLNNAGLSPASLPARDAVIRWARRYAAEGVFCGGDYLRAVKAARGSLARLLDADPGEIAFFPSTAGAVSQVAFGIGLGPGDEVVTWDQEYGSNLHPWRAAAEEAGARLVVLPSGSDLATPAERILDALTPRTRAIGISWVQYRAGSMTELGPVAAEARRRGIWTVIDVIQGIGALPFSFRSLGIDAVCGGSHKWLAAPIGAGYLCIRADRIGELRPRAVGAHTYGTSEDVPRMDPTLRPDARRFEPGSLPVLEIAALGAAVELLLEAGISEVSAEALRLSGMLADGLRILGYRVAAPNGPVQRTPIVTFAPGEGSPMESVEAATAALARRKVAFAIRDPGIRLSPHAHNSEEDIARALEALGR